MQAYIVFSLRVQCRRKESSRSLSHLLMSFLSEFFHCQNQEKTCNNTITKDAVHVYERRLISSLINFVFPLRP